MTEAEQGNTLKTKKKLYQKKGFWATIVVFMIIGAITPKAPAEQTQTKTNPASESKPIPVEGATPAKEEPAPAEAKPQEPSVPTEYKSALSKATAYATTMHMSKQGVYDQLTSEYGEKFTAEAAKYAIDNVKADWNANALAKAKDYQTQMQMSRSAIHDQLTSSYGEKFTQPEADYAVQHLSN